MSCRMDGFSNCLMLSFPQCDWTRSIHGSHAFCVLGASLVNSPLIRYFATTEFMVPDRGAMYAQYRCLRAADCLVLQPGTSAAEGASFFVNPLTALGMVETMRREGHTALVHTAAASNLGQMLMKFPLETSQMRTKASEQLSPECWIPPGNAVASTSCATCSLIPVGRHGASSPPSSTVPTCRLFHPPSRR